MMPFRYWSHWGEGHARKGLGTWAALALPHPVHAAPPGRQAEALILSASGSLALGPQHPSQGPQDAAASEWPDGPHPTAPLVGPHAPRVWEPPAPCPSVACAWWLPQEQQSLCM